MIDVSFSCVWIGSYLARIAQDNGIIRNIEINIGQWGNQYIVSNADFAHNHCICPHPHMVTNGWRSLIGAAPGCANGHAMCNIAVIANDGKFADYNGAKMADVKAFADLAAYLKTKFIETSEKLSLQL